LGEVTALLGQFGNEGVDDLDNFYTEVSDLLWQAVFNWERDFPHRNEKRPTFHRDVDDLGKLLKLEEELQENNDLLRKTEQRPDLDGQKIRDLALLQNKSVALESAIHETLENHVAGKADAHAYGKPPAVVEPKVLRIKEPKTLDELLHDLRAAVHDGELYEMRRAMIQAELAKKIKFIERAEAEQGAKIIPRSDKRESFEKVKMEILEMPGSMTSTMSSTMTEVLSEENAMYETIPVIVEMQTEAERDAAVRKVARKAGQLLIEGKLLRVTTEEIARFCEEVVEPVYEQALLHCEDAAAASDADIFKSAETNLIWYEGAGEQYIQGLNDDLEKVQDECEELRERGSGFLSKITKLDTNFEFYSNAYFRELEWEQTTRDRVVNYAAWLVKAGYQYENRQVRLDARKAAYSSQRAFIQRIAMDVETLTALARDNQGFEERINSVVIRLATFQKNAENHLEEIPFKTGEAGMASRLRTLLSRPALYKAWVRASLADLGHAQVHAPAGPEHAPGAAAQPAARHPGVAGAAAGAGHV
jgi:hypothetical protein